MSTWPRNLDYWRDVYTITPTRYPRIHIGHVIGQPEHSASWVVFGTDDLDDTAHTGPGFARKREVLAWIDSPDAADWRTDKPGQITRHDAEPGIGN